MLIQIAVKWAVQCNKIHLPVIASTSELPYYPMPSLFLLQTGETIPTIVSSSFPGVMAGERKNETAAISMEYLCSIVAVLAICSPVHLFTFRVGRFCLGHKYVTAQGIKLESAVSWQLCLKNECTLKSKHLETQPVQLRFIQEDICPHWSGLRRLWSIGGSASTTERKKTIWFALGQVICTLQYR